MALKIQYNKTFLQRIKKQLSIRERALPTLQSKEAALRVEVKKAKDRMDELQDAYEKMAKKYENIVNLWAEFEPELVKIKDVDFESKKIAGVMTPVFHGVDIEIADFSLFNKPDWFLDGVMVLKELTEILIERDFFKKKMEILDYARKKTTQKVNLYEKVQIPQFEDAIRKINRFLEDEENLSKSSQKIVKKRKEAV
jgi:V/A-type H+/Na+-transporting ATPase subunit D